MYDVAIIGSGFWQIELAVELANANKKVVVLTCDHEILPATADQQRNAPYSSTSVAPWRGGFGFHYLSDPETIKQILNSTFALLRRYPILAENMIHPQTDYHFLKDSTSCTWEQAERGLLVLQNEYTKLYEDSASDAIRPFLPHPSKIYEVIDPNQIPDLNAQYKGNILKTIITSEGIINISLVYSELKKKIEQLKATLCVINGVAVDQVIVNEQANECILEATTINNIKQKKNSYAKKVVYGTWINNNFLIKHTRVHSSSFPSEEISLEPKKTFSVRLKEIVRAEIQADYVAPLYKSLGFPGKLSDNGSIQVGVRSCFVGFGPNGVMLAIASDEAKKASDGISWVPIRATSVQHTNLYEYPIQDNGSINIRQKIDQEYSNNVEALGHRANHILDDVCAVKNIPRDAIRPKSIAWNLGTVLTDRFDTSFSEAMESGGELNKRHNLYAETVYGDPKKENAPVIVAAWCMKALNAISLCDEVKGLLGFAAVSACSNKNQPECEDKVSVFAGSVSRRPFLTDKDEIKASLTYGRVSHLGFFRKKQAAYETQWHSESESAVVASIKQVLEGYIPSSRWHQFFSNRTGEHLKMVAKTLTFINNDTTNLFLFGLIDTLCCNIKTKGELYQRTLFILNKLSEENDKYDDERQKIFGPNFEQQQVSDNLNQYNLNLKKSSQRKKKSILDIPPRVYNIR